MEIVRLAQLASITLVASEGLGCLAAGQGDAVGLYCAATVFKSRSVRVAVHADLKLVLDELGSLESRRPDRPACLRLHEAAERIAQRALVIVISDLLMDPAELKHAIQHLRFRRHDVAVFHLLEQNEIDFVFDRPMRFLDLRRSPRTAGGSGHHGPAIS
ncbi:MAG UNVERIFIED_CONTAM: hypothetical protein LVR18_42975 [Planctomycetaceae bacterium]